jgi:hypothetical protein
MTGNPINKNLVHDSVSISHGCAPQLFGAAKNKRKAAEKAAHLRKVTLWFLFGTTSWQHL